MSQAKANKPEITLRSHKALEMIMRDVLDSMHDAACVHAYNPHSDCVQILSISPPPNPDVTHSNEIATIHPLPSRRSSNVLDFLMKRESGSNHQLMCQNC